MKSLSRGWGLCALATSALLACGPGPTGSDGGTDVVTGDTGPSTAAITQISAGMLHSCARLADGHVTCWGANYTGQLGDGTAAAGAMRLTPAEVPGITDATSVAVGRTFSCALRASGEVLCWGLNSFGQLGDGTLTQRNSPAPVMGLTGVVELAASFGHACARTMSGTVLCWGSNTQGEAGTDTMGAPVQTPTAVPGITDVADLALGESHTCARVAGGRVMCWGLNSSGQLGDGTNANHVAPAMVVALADAVEITAGERHTCARAMSGAVQCWGSNTDGQLGDGTAGMIRMAPTAVVGLSDAAEVSAGGAFSCARRTSGAVQCWGNNDLGQIGNGTMLIARLMPTDVMSLADATGLTTGTRHVCATRATGVPVCWGDNGAGQLGNGTTMPATTPTPITP